MPKKYGCMTRSLKDFQYKLLSFFHLFLFFFFVCLFFYVLFSQDMKSYNPITNNFSIHFSEDCFSGFHTVFGGFISYQLISMNGGEI